MRTGPVSGGRTGESPATASRMRTGPVSGRLSLSAVWKLRWMVLVVIFVAKDLWSDSLFPFTSAVECHCSAKCHPRYMLVPDHSACVDPAAGVVSMPLSEQEKKEIVELHNHYRRLVKPTAAMMFKMYWDDEIGKIAQRFVDSCPSTHDSNGARAIPGDIMVGQNLHGIQPSFNAAITGWYNEVKDFEGQYGLNKTTKGGWGHYTQVVWGTSYRLGCARAVCNKKSIYVCNYGPPGNWNPANVPYKAGAKCADCLKCDDGLCDCGLQICKNFGKLNASTCKCDCGDNKLYKNSPNCELDCSAGSDAWFCGKEGYEESKCGSWWYQSTCPNMCKLCSCGKLNLTSIKCASSGTRRSAPTTRWTPLACLSAVAFSVMAISTLIASC